jgi:predicted cupin superfamily sugar epimerase
MDDGKRPQNAPGKRPTKANIERMDASEIIKRLDMQPHPEGGHFVEIYREGSLPRGTISSIYFLLQAGERSHWHKVTDAPEIWAWHGGDPLRLEIAAEIGPENGSKIGAEISPENTGIVKHTLGLDLGAGQTPQAIVPAGAWQAAHSLGSWSLVGCMVGPAFEFAKFELAPPDWSPAAN